MRILQASTFLLLSLAAAAAGAQALGPKPAELQYRPSTTQKYPIGVCQPPVWPREALRYEIEGVTTIRYKLRPDGSVMEPHVAVSSGWAILDDATIALALTCKYTPEQAAQAQGAELPLQFVWTLDGKRTYARLVPGSCAASERFSTFLPLERRSTDPTGVKLRFLIDANGKAHHVKFEGNDIDPALADEVLAWVDTCRFAFDPLLLGERTDTMYGRVLLR